VRIHDETCKTNNGSEVPRQNRRQLFNQDVLRVSGSVASRRARQADMGLRRQGLYGRFSVGNSRCWGCAKVARAPEIVLAANLRRGSRLEETESFIIGSGRADWQLKRARGNKGRRMFISGAAGREETGLQPGGTLFSLEIPIVRL